MKIHRTRCLECPFRLTADCKNLDLVMVDFEMVELRKPDPSSTQAVNAKGRTDNFEDDAYWRVRFAFYVALIFKETVFLLYVYEILAGW